MKKAIFVLVGIALMILVAGCVSAPEKPVAKVDEFNCNINGVAYNVTSGICHGFGGTEPFSDPDYIKTINITDAVITIIPTPTPKPTPTYVTCSKYHIVTDKWKTPDGFYVTADNATYYESSEQYSATKVGSYVTIHSDGAYLAYNRCDTDTSTVIRWGNGVCDVINVKPVSEAESGYRDACEVIP